jgi:hypothetical protein
MAELVEGSGLRFYGLKRSNNFREVLNLAGKFIIKRLLFPSGASRKGGAAFGEERELYQ